MKGEGSRWLQFVLDFGGGIGCDLLDSRFRGNDGGLIRKGAAGWYLRLISDGVLVPAFARMTLLVCGFPLSRE